MLQETARQTFENKTFAQLRELRVLIGRTEQFCLLEIKKGNGLQLLRPISTPRMYFSTRKPIMEISGN